METSRLSARMFLLGLCILTTCGCFVLWIWLPGLVPSAVLLVAGLAFSAIFAFVVYVAITIRTHTGLSRTMAPMRRVEGVSADDIDRFFAADGTSRLTAHQVISFAGCIVAPRDFFVRISEHVESYHRSTLVRSVYTVRLYPTDSSSEETPESSPSGYVIPLYLPGKGGLTDGLRVFDGGGKRISTIDTRTQNAYAAAALRFLVKFASDTAFRTYMADGRRREKLVLAVLASTTPSPAGIEAAADVICELDRSVHAADTLQLVVDLMRNLARYRPISVGVSREAVDATRWPLTHRFTIERRFVAQIEPAPNGRLTQRASRQLDGLRLALAVRLNRIYFPLDAAYRTDSYHLEVEGAPGTYFARGEIFEPPLHAGETLAYEAADQERHGQRRSHTYIRRMSGAAGSFYGAQFFERSPGSFASASIASLVSSVLIVTLAAMTLASSPPEDRTPSLIPALLALPIAVSAFLGLDNSAKRHPSLLSRVIAFVTALLSLSAFVLTLLKDAYPVWPVVWHLLMWASVSTTLIAFASWCIRLTIETTFARRKGGR